MNESLQFRFKGTDGLVDLSGCEQVAGYLPELFQHWPYEQVDSATPKEDSETLLRVESLSGHYHISSPVFETNQRLKDPLNMACSLVAELAWAQLRHRPQMLCFHGAAIEVNGALVLFPSQRRAGKSTVTACLAALGFRVFTDDYLLIELDADGVIYGHANGAAPRLRLPLPPEFSPELAQKLESMRGPSNRQYQYFLPEAEGLAHHGERLPVSGIVLLDRQEDVDMRLEQAGESAILRRVILQNFSRHMNPARILGMIGHLVGCTQGFELHYSSAEQAATMLAAELSGRPPFQPETAYGAPPALAPPELAQLEEQGGFVPARRYVQSGAICSLDFETECFLASVSGNRIQHLDQLARAIWMAFETPATLQEVVSLFASVFPDQPVDTLREDIGNVVGMLARQGLLTQAEGTEGEK